MTPHRLPSPQLLSVIAGSLLQFSLPLVCIRNSSPSTLLSPPPSDLLRASLPHTHHLSVAQIPPIAYGRSADPNHDLRLPDRATRRTPRAPRRLIRAIYSLQTACIYIPFLHLQNPSLALHPCLPELPLHPAIMSTESTPKQSLDADDPQQQTTSSSRPSRTSHARSAGSPRRKSIQFNIGGNPSTGSTDGPPPRRSASASARRRSQFDLPTRERNKSSERDRPISSRGPSPPPPQ